MFPLGICYIHRRISANVMTSYDTDTQHVEDTQHFADTQPMADPQPLADIQPVADTQLVVDTQPVQFVKPGSQTPLGVNLRSNLPVGLSAGGQRCKRKLLEDDLRYFCR